MTAMSLEHASTFTAFEVNPAITRLSVLLFHIDSPLVPYIVSG